MSSSSANLLRSAEEYKRYFIDENPSYAMTFLDPQGNILSWNLGAEKLFGYRPEEVLGRYFSIPFIVEDVTVGIPERELKDAIERGIGEDERWSLRKDGTRFWAEGTTSSIKDADGKLMGFVKIARDNTLRKNTEDQMKSKMTEVNCFLGQMAHDIKEPLRTISSYLSLIQKEATDNQLSSRAKEFLELAVSGASRLGSLVEGLLNDVSNTQQAQRVTRVDCNAVFDMAVSDLKVLIEENQAIVTRGVLPVIDAVPSEILEVFQNLISNSIRFRRAEPPLIYADSEEKNGQWILCFKDNGQGFPPEKSEEIFKPFTRLGNDEKKRGAGLGLAICRKIIEKHGGRIWAESVPERGTIFHIAFPVHRGRR